MGFRVRGADYHGHAGEDLDLIGFACLLDGDGAGLVDVLFARLDVWPDAEYRFRVPPGERHPAPGPAGLKQYRCELQGRFAHVGTGYLKPGAVVVDFMDHVRIGMDVFVRVADGYCGVDR